MFTYQVLYLNGQFHVVKFRSELSTNDVMPPFGVPMEIVGSFMYYTSASHWAQVNRRDCPNYLPGM